MKCCTTAAGVRRLRGRGASRAGVQLATRQRVTVVVKELGTSATDRREEDGHSGLPTSVTNVGAYTKVMRNILCLVLHPQIAE